MYNEELLGPIILIPSTPLYRHQKHIWNIGFDGQIVNGKKKKARFLALEWHRRSGKDIFSLQFLLGKAYEESGNYFYVFPQKNQARLAIFEGIDKKGKKILDYIPRQLVKKIDKNEMKIFILTKDGRESTIQFIGADADSKVGANFKGGIFSEYAVYRSTKIWELIEPMIQFNGGWVLFNSTPRGRNHWAELHNKFKELSKTDPSYYAETLTIEDTSDWFGRPLMTKKEFDQKLKEGLIPKELLLQEYYCSRDAASAGGWYKDQLYMLEHANNPPMVEWYAETPQMKFMLDPLEPLYVSFDIGGPTDGSDYMVLWFGQNRGTDHVMFAAYGNTGELIGHYMDKIRQFRTENKMRGPTYIFLPHDAKRRDNIQGRSLLSFLTESYPQLRLIPVPKTNDKIADIHFTRDHMMYYSFANNARDGFENLKFFSKKLNRSTNEYSDEDFEHNFYSHWADSFKTYVIGMDILLKRKDYKFGNSVNYAGF